MEIERKFILKELPGDLDMYDYYHIEQGYISTEPVIHSEDFLCDATLKGEFVRVVNAADGLDSRERTRILRCGLRALLGESLF